MSGYRLVTSDLLQISPSGQNYFRSDFQTVKMANTLSLEKTKNVNETLMANRCLVIDWLSQIHCKASLAAKTTSGPILELKIANNL
jgi:hypothetical protein